jgi:hypothetical protein
MSINELVSNYFSVIVLAVSGIVAVAILKRDVKQMDRDMRTIETTSLTNHKETARRVDRIEEANMMNAQSNAVLSANIVNLKEQLIDMKNTFKEEMTSFRNMLESLLRDQKK